MALRRGPYALLALAICLAVVTAGEFPLSDSLAVIGALVATAALLHLGAPTWLGQRGPRRRRRTGVHPTALGDRFALMWLNPSFAIFAVVGNFDAHLCLPRRGGNEVLVATAVTMAGSQSGGLPPQSTMRSVAFGGLFAFNAGQRPGRPR